MWEDFVLIHKFESMAIWSGVFNIMCVFNKYIVHNGVFFHNRFWRNHCQDNPSSICLIRLCSIGAMNTHDNLPRINIWWRGGTIFASICVCFVLVLNSVTPQPQGTTWTILTQEWTASFVLRVSYCAMWPLFALPEKLQIVSFRSNDDFLISCSLLGWKDKIPVSSGIIFIVIGGSGHQLGDAGLESSLFNRLDPPLPYNEERAAT